MKLVHYMKPGNRGGTIRWYLQCSCEYGIDRHDRLEDQGDVKLTWLNRNNGPFIYSRWWGFHWSGIPELPVCMELVSVQLQRSITAFKGGSLEQSKGRAHTLPTTLSSRLNAQKIRPVSNRTLGPAMNLGTLRLLGLKTSIEGNRSHKPA